jgi:hypothetical protein
MSRLYRAATRLSKLLVGNVVHLAVSTYPPAHNFTLRLQNPQVPECRRPRAQPDTLRDLAQRRQVVVVLLEAPQEHQDLAATRYPLLDNSFGGDASRHARNVDGEAPVCLRQIQLSQETANARVLNRHGARVHPAVRPLSFPESRVQLLRQLLRSRPCVRPESHRVVVLQGDGDDPVATAGAHDGIAPPTRKTARRR